MPGSNLTQIEAEERREIVSHPAYVVSLDVTQGAKTFTSSTTLTFDAKPGDSTFLDLIAPTVDSIVLNGATLDPAVVFKDDRIALEHLQEHNQVDVTATCAYSRTGEGLHRSVDPADGRIYLYSQFEVPDARRVYAVFDQPDLKATFDFTVVAPESWTVLSNSPVASVENLAGKTAEGTLGDAPAEGIKRWIFEQTPTMSSYLTAFVAGPYAGWTSEYANEDGRTIPMGLYCRQSLKDAFDKDTESLFDVTKKGFAFYAKTWGVPYPYAKYDQVFVPEYNAGAMENIALVTLRDSYIFESKVSGAVINRRVETVLHELAHMWFGDYVTMKWWNDLWLNESFAEFMSTLATSEATEHTDDWATFCSGEKSWALAEDQMPTTHPIVAPIHDLNDTYVNFDGITYAKGASVLKQLVAYVGRAKFFEGIHSYLTKHAYGNATLHDLLVELSKASGRDLDSWSKLWLEQSGINTITADIDTNSEGTITKADLVQTAPAEFPVTRPHRIAVGFYNPDDNGKIVRTDRFELDVDGERTEISDIIGLKRPRFILVNDDDLTYTKLRFDKESLNFAEAHLYAFKDPLARAVIWLSLWDMTRDAEFPAERFVTLSLKAVSTEKQSTTFRYALSQISGAVHNYVAPSRRASIMKLVAQTLWKLVLAAEAGSDEQFQLLQVYLGYGVDDDFEDNAQGLLSGELKLEGLSIDNSLRWLIIHALAANDLISDEAIDAELSKRETTENREKAYGAKAARPTAQTKKWAWTEALDDDALTNSQIEAVAAGFSQNTDPQLYEGYVDRFFSSIDSIWKDKSFHIAETLICPLGGQGLYPRFADAHKLVAGGERWLEEHADADRALRGMIMKNLDVSRRVLKVQTYNSQL
ncbi:aminopeptidase N [Bifidobacterium aquikefiricola]|uniref:Aminopeptidase N n=1 Tax=Bifidobacterium aquikefiricola TaxID=3059038 RepID=A0AB39U543_9BIFI